MKLVTKSNLLLILFLGISYSIFGQQKPQSEIITTGQGDKYVKSCAVVSAGFTECILCDNKELTKNCNKYYCSAGKCELVYVKTAVIENIRTSIGINRINNVKLDEIAPGINVHYVDDGNYRAYIMNNDKGYHVVVYERPVAKKPSAADNSKKANCLDLCKGGVDSCTKKCGKSDYCFSQCLESALDCNSFCRKYAQRSVFDIPTLNNSRTRTTKQQ